MQLAKFVLVSVSILATSGQLLAKSRCESSDYSALVSETEGRIEKRVPMKVPTHFFNGSNRCGCALMAFTIDVDGRATDIEMVNSFPDRSVAASAKRALTQYHFIPGTGGTKGAIVFKIRDETQE